MKTVFSNHSQVAHVWAQNNQECGRASRMFFENGVIYSYGKHFAIAKHVTNAAGVRAVMFNSDSYSSTTTTHKIVVRDALRGLGVPIFEMPESLWQVPIDDVSMHFRMARDECIAKATRARKNTEWFMQAAFETCVKFNAYAEYMGSELRLYLPDDVSMAALKASIKEQAKRYAEENKERNRILAEREARDKQDALERLRKWCNGEDVPMGTMPYGLPTALRINGNFIQTSRGAEVPVRAAKALWPMIQSVREKGHAYYADYTDPVTMIGAFPLRRINGDGSVVIGCHELAYEELARVAGLLGLDVTDSIQAAA